MYDYYITDEEYAEAEKNGIYYQLLNTRIRDLGWDKQRAINTSVKRKRGHESHGHYPQQAIDNNISLSTYYSRVERGMSKEKASTKPVLRGKDKLKLFNGNIGKPRKYPDWVYDNLEKHGIAQPTFWHRVNRGWTLEKASTKKVMT